MTGAPPAEVVVGYRMRCTACDARLDTTAGQPGLDRLYETWKTAHRRPRLWAFVQTYTANRWERVA